MSALRTTAPHTPPAQRRAAVRTVGRWMVSFAGYPLGGHSNIDTVGAAGIFERAS